MVPRIRCAVLLALLSGTFVFAAQPDRRDVPPPLEIDWRRDALANLRVAVTNHLITKPTELAAYIAGGFNAFVLFDAESFNDSATAWNFKSEDEIRAETSFARDHGLPIILGMAVEPYGAIPQASDIEIIQRVQLWRNYGDDVIIGVFPWYDDVFLFHVDVDRQRHVSSLIKQTAANWYVFGMIGEFGFNATKDDVARYFDPSTFDHLIVLMYPYNVGAEVTGFPLDNVASPDPDGDITRYVDRYITHMDDKFFRVLHGGQLILLVGQAFYYTGEIAGHIPRANDIAIMTLRGNERLREIPGQTDNYSAAYYWWGGESSAIVGLSQRSDWLASVREVHQEIGRAGRQRIAP